MTLRPSPTKAAETPTKPEGVTAVQITPAMVGRARAITPRTLLLAPEGRTRRRWQQSIGGMVALRRLAAQLGPSPK